MVTGRPDGEKSRLNLLRHSITAAAALGIFALIAAALVAYTHEQTRQRILFNQRQALLHTLQAVLPAGSYDNNLFQNSITVRDPALLGTKASVPVYRATLKGKPVAVIMTPVAPEGYNGPIRLLVGINFNGTVSGVRVLSQNETPGLGDQIEISKTDWITHFKGKSLTNPEEKLWGVKRDGGAFDQFTGATITPRAVVKAIKDCLVYFRTHRKILFAGVGKEISGQ